MHGWAELAWWLAEAWRVKTNNMVLEITQLDLDLKQIKTQNEMKD